MNPAIDRTRFGTAANVRAGLIVFAVSLLLLAMFLSSSLQSYAYDLPVNPLTETIVAWVDAWHGWMEAIGAVQVAEGIADAVARFHDMTFAQ
ncbi:MAG: hypothetical protein KF723_00385 [Rhizobiaceae bacterium]|nr:hypothetical protein [Rhizobiaceae bacterium]